MQDHALRQGILSTSQLTSLTTFSPSVVTSRSVSYIITNAIVSRLNCQLPPQTVPVASPLLRQTSEGSHGLVSGGVAVPSCAARFHTSIGNQRPARAHLQASNRGTSQSSTGRKSAVNNQLPQLFLRGPQEPASLHEGYDEDLPEQARGNRESSSSTAQMDSIMDAAVVDDAVRTIQERRERREKQKQERYAGNGAGMPSTSASQQSTTQQRRQAAVAGQQLRAGAKIDLICETLAFGGQVGYIPIY